MLDYINDWCLFLGLNGIWLDLVVSLIVAIIIACFVIIIGRCIDIIETFLMTQLAKIFSPKIASLIMNRITFIGTIFHELSHAIMIWICGGKILKLRLFEINKSGRLGHVEFSTRGPRWKQLLQLSFGSCAPVVFGIVEEYVLISMIFHYKFDLWIQILLWYLIVSIFVHMSMSKEDLKHYLHGMIIVFPILVLLSMVYQYFFR